MLAYERGSILLWYGVANIVAIIPAFLYYIPLIHRLKLASIYKVNPQNYLKIFNKFEEIYKFGCLSIFIYNLCLIEANIYDL